MLVNKKIQSNSKLLSRDGSQKKDGRRVRSGPVKGLQEPYGVPAPTSTSASYRHGQQVAHPHQVVGSRRPSEHPAHSRQTAEARLAHQGHRLEPSENLFHPLPFPLTHGIASVPGGPL